MSSKKAPKAVAVLTLFDPAKLSPKQAKAVSAWLRRQSEFVLKHHKRCARRFSARYVHAKS